MVCPLRQLFDSKRQPPRFHFCFVPTRSASPALSADDAMPSPAVQSGPFRQRCTRGRNCTRYSDSGNGSCFAVRIPADRCTRHSGSGLRPRIHPFRNTIGVLRGIPPVQRLLSAKRQLQHQNHPRAGGPAEQQNTGRRAHASVFQLAAQLHLLQNRFGKTPRIRPAPEHQRLGASLPRIRRGTDAQPEHAVRVPSSGNRGTCGRAANTVLPLAQLGYIARKQNLIAHLLQRVGQRLSDFPSGGAFPALGPAGAGGPPVQSRVYQYFSDHTFGSLLHLERLTVVQPPCYIICTGRQSD